MNVVIVGAGLAGARTAETLRALGLEGRVTLVGDEPVAPYERPALSKEFLAGAREAERLLLRPHAFWQERGIELRLGRRVVSVDRARRVAIADGDVELPWDALVLATGARPRRLPLVAPQGVHALRTLDDARRLRDSLVPESRLVVIGGGFVGAEVASTALGLGVRVQMVEAGPAPLARPLGAEVGRLLAKRYRAHGLELHAGVGVAFLSANAAGRLSSVVLTDGRELRADAALVAIGVEPDTWLAPSRPHPDIHLCGDLVGPGHWTSAAVDGAAVAHRILGLEPPAPQPPYVWSDQFGLRLQLVGDPRSTVAVELEGDDDSFAVRYRDETGATVGALLANRPRDVAALRRELPLAA
jgi:NADPH-dependent 2,4-dienoyl-CoA reductase/sulfur reductase-like enzyme